MTSRPNRYADLACELQALAEFLRRDGERLEQRFYEWQRIERIEADSTRGGGTGMGSSDTAAEREASRTLHLWRTDIATLTALVPRVRIYGKVAFPKTTGLELRHMTVAQVEADGGCGSHWRIREFVTVERRPTGEPFYRGRCRRCGSWPDGDPPLDVLETWRDGRTLRVAAS